MLRVTMENEGGELDSKTVKTEKAAGEAIMEMIRAAGGNLCDGDRFFVREIGQKGNDL